MGNIRLLKKIDQLLGNIVIGALPAALCHGTIGKVKSILLIRPGGIGDAVLLMAAIKVIKQANPTCIIDILSEKRNSAVFTLSADIRAVYLYHSPFDLLSVLRNRYDAVIDTEQWYRLSAVVARLVRAPVKIGYWTNERQRLFTDPVPYSQDDSETVSFLKLLHPLGFAVPSNVNAPFLRIPDTSASVADSLLKQTKGEPFVALFPGASVREKRWKKERLISLAANLISQTRLVVIGGREDVSISNDIAKGGGLNLAGRTSLAETAAIIARAEVLVSSDSGVLHLAAGLGVPTVALFGPSSIAKWAPRGSNDRVVSAKLPCSPCSRYGTIPPCRHDVGCMDKITVDQVTMAVESVIAERGSRNKN